MILLWLRGPMIVRTRLQRRIACRLAVWHIGLKLLVVAECVIVQLMSKKLRFLGRRGDWSVDES